MPPNGEPLVMSICPNCGAETRPGDNFCLSCGYRLPPASNSWSGGSEPTVLGQDAEEATLRANAVPSKIENPARFVLSSNKGNGPKEYPLGKPDTSIGRAHQK